jgi:hypothetical protein
MAKSSWMQEARPRSLESSQRDATTVPFKQIIIAAGDGAKAALGAFDYLIRSPAEVQ